MLLTLRPWGQVRGQKVIQCDLLSTALVNKGYIIIDLYIYAFDVCLLLSIYLDNNISCFPIDSVYDVHSTLPA